VSVSASDLLIDTFIAPYVLIWRARPQNRPEFCACIRQRWRQAIVANSGPHHILAMKLAAASFAEYRLERWVLQKVNGSSDLFVEAYEGGDVGW